MTEATTPTRRLRIEGADGIRGLACIGVVVAHAMILLDDGAAITTLLSPLAALMLHGVSIFFVLSGFLLYLPFARAILSGRSFPRLTAYSRHRLLRIWPLYLVALAGTSALGLFVISSDGAGTGEGLGYPTDPVLLITNVLLVQGYSPHTVYTGLGVSWTLITEVGFYVLLPLLGWIGWRMRHRGVLAALVPAFILLAVGVVARVSVVAYALSASSPEITHERQFAGNWSTVVIRSVLGQGDLFAFGMMGAVAVVAVTGLDAALRLRRVCWIVLGVSAVVLTALRIIEVAALPVGLATTAGLCLLVLPGSTRVPDLVRRLLVWAPVRITGDLSYGMYLWHFPVLWLMRLHLDFARYQDTVGMVVTLALVMLCTYVLAWVSHVMVERPAMQWRRRLDARDRERAARTSA